jgi:hypothetical protein
MSLLRAAGLFHDMLISLSGVEIKLLPSATCLDDAGIFKKAKLRLPPICALIFVLSANRELIRMNCNFMDASLMQMYSKYCIRWIFLSGL